MNIFICYKAVLVYIGDCSEYSNIINISIKNTRDSISHYSRYGMTEYEFSDCRRECISLLENIYGYQTKQCN